MNRWLTLALLAAVVVGGALRMAQLDQRPLHTDESVHAIKFLGLWERGVYRYDPDEYHGPWLYYATLPLAWLSGAQTASELSETTLRLAPALTGLGLILLVVLMRPGLGSVATGFGALFTAVSPAFVYYSRYYIHEIPLVFFSLLLTAAIWRYWWRPGVGWAVLAGAALGGLHATKETFVFVVLAVGAGFGAAALAGRGGDRSGEGAAALSGAGSVGARFVGVRTWHVVVGLLVAAGVSVVLFSSFFTNAAGPVDSVRTYLPWFERAGGKSPHVHPWWFYFQRLLWFHPARGVAGTEAAIVVLGLVGMIRAWRGGGGRRVEVERFLSVYTVVLAGIYAVLPYKTPWCLLGFHHGFILLAGVGVAALWDWVQHRPLRWGLGIVLTVAVGHLGWQAWHGAGPYGADRRNPYVYAHTSKDLLRLVRQVQEILGAQSPPPTPFAKVVGAGGDYWPLPWYFRGLPGVGWYGELPADPYAPIMVVDASIEAELDEKSEKRWLMVGLFEQRPRRFFELYVAFDVWKRYIETRPPPVDED